MSIEPQKPEAPGMFVLVSNKWSNYVNTNLVSLRNEGTLCDVTLAGNEGENHLAHSSILAAASSVLKSCLVQAPRGHYVVKIPSITSPQWQLLLDFIYQGRVKVTLSEKSDLLTASQTLGLWELVSLLKACAPSQDEVHNTSAVVSGIEPKPHRMEAVFGHQTSSDTTDVVQDVQLMDTEESKSTDSKPTQEKTNPPATKNTKNNKYTCSLCGKSFPWGKALHIHELMHKNTKHAMHQCGTCSKMFLSYHSLSAHKRTHSFHPYKCEECNAGFHFKVNYELHMWKKHQKQVSGEKYNCTYCTKSFVANGLLQRHLSQAHGLRKAKSSVHPDKKALKNVLMSVCGFCDAKFVSKDSLAQHFQRHHQIQNPEFCEICNVAFESRERVVQHHQVHIAKAKSSEKSERASETAAAVLSIRPVYLPEERSSYKCNLCQVECKSMRLLSKHTRTHEGQISEDLWRCPVCSAEFDNKPDFSIHIAEHRGEKTFVCKYCDKGFTHKGNYSTHVQRHLGIKPFSCKYCPKTFVRKDDMKSHMRVHTGEKPYPCKVCNMKFSCISNLREHERAKHNVTFSKRNPNIIMPRQHRPKVKYRSKNVAQFDVSEASSDLLELGVIPEPSATSTDQQVAQSIEIIQQNTEAAPENSIQNQLIVGEAGQEEYYQVVEAANGIQTLAPIIGFDQKTGQGVTFTLQGQDMVKVGAGEMVPLVVQSAAVAGEGVIMSEGGQIISEGGLVMSDRAPKIEGVVIQNEGENISEVTSEATSEGGLVMSEGGMAMSEQQELEAEQLEDEDEDGKSEEED